MVSLIPEDINVYSWYIHRSNACVSIHVAHTSHQGVNI